MIETATLSATTTKTGTMQAYRLAAPGKVEAVNVPIPEPAADEVRIRIEGCGLCASSLPQWEGRDWLSYPAEPGSPGHEAWGMIDAVGTSVTELQPGDRVAALTYKGLAEYDLAKADAVVKLPSALNGQPFPGEPLGCAMNIFERSDIRSGQTVAIIGIGFLGALLVQLAKQAGARVIALSRRQSSLELARQNGADEVIALDDHYRIIEQVKAITQENFCDRVIEATGKEWPLNLAGELCAIRGKLIIAGFHQDGMRQLNVQLWNWRGLDVINAHERDPQVYVQGIRKAVKAVASGKLHPQKLYTHQFKSGQLQQAFELQHAAPEGFVKALVSFS